MSTATAGYSGEQLEISGVNRLLAFAQELGVREVRGVPRSESTRGGANGDEAHSAVATDQSHFPDDGLKITLSPTASRLAKSLLQTTGDKAPPTVNAEPAITSRNTTVASEAEHGIGEAGSTNRPTTSPNARRAVAAYQRNNSALPGEQIRIRV